jgi:hypothetical protein
MALTPAGDGTQLVQNRSAATATGGQRPRGSASPAGTIPVQMRMPSAYTPETSHMLRPAIAKAVEDAIHCKTRPGRQRAVSDDDKSGKVWDSLPKGQSGHTPAPPQHLCATARNRPVLM